MRPYLSRRRRDRSGAAGLLAAALAGSVTVVIALILPWLVGGITGPRKDGDLPLGEAGALDVWAQLLALPAAVALGALASRAATSSVRYGVIVLVGGSVGALVESSVAPSLAPPLMITARTLTAAPTTATVATLTLHALALDGGGPVRVRLVAPHPRVTPAPHRP